MDSDEELVFLDVDSAEDLAARPPSRPRPRWLWLLLAVVVAGAVVLQKADRHPPSAAPSAQSGAPSSSEVAPVPGIDNTAAVTITRLGHRLLGQTGGWTLFGRGEGRLVKIDLARGEITRTGVPLLQSSGPVSFVPAAGRVFIRPIDYVPSYFVPDGQAVQQLPARFGPGGPILPGPDAGHVWVDTGNDPSPAVVLTSLDGQPTGTVLRLPADSGSLDAVSDGVGYLLVTAMDGVYRTQPGRTHRISTGRVLAVGPTGWLVAECDRQQHCQRVLIDRTTSRRRVLGREAPNGGSRPPWGAISSDGRTAAIFDVGSDGFTTIELLDLRTGSLRATGMHVENAVNDGTIRWSPDSRWLFAVAPDGGLDVLAPATGQVRTLSGLLPPLTQLAVRTGD